jgi:predicted phosphodiesterase
VDLILSDLHANLHALRGVLRFAHRRAIRRFVILGDLVGYGAQPNQLLDRVRKLKPRFAVRGNHDKVIAGVEAGGAFSGPARQSAEWTSERLSAENRRFLQELPQGPLWVGEDYQIAHGSPEDEDAYILHPREAAHAFDAFQGQLCFYGHTHLPGLYELDEMEHRLNWIELEAEQWFQLKPQCRYLVNPGSTGQPRDRDRRLAFMTFDARRRRVRLHRLDYDWQGAAQSILDAGLHENLADRLSFGM